jgi:hypothetical protein
LSVSQPHSSGGEQEAAIGDLCDKFEQDEAVRKLYIEALSEAPPTRLASPFTL